MIIAAVVAILVFAIAGAPLFAVLLAAALLGFFAADIELANIGIELYRLTDTPLLLALPLFTFVGYLLSEARTSERLVRLTLAMFGWLPSGLAVVALLACAVFTALTGASGVTIIALGALLLPSLLKGGYDERFSLGLVTSSGSLGLLIVPSVPLILYGIVAQQLDVGVSFTLQELFIAALLPAGIMIALLVGWTLWRHRGGKIPRTPFSFAELGGALWEARWELPLPFVVLGGIYGGFFAISEAAAVTAFYAIIAEVVLYRDVSWRQLPNVMKESMVMVGSILLILAAAMAFTSYLIDAEVPQTVFDFVRAHIDDALTFLILLNILLLILGAFLDVFSAIVIMVPLLLPLAVGYGIHPVHLGIVFLANMQIGYLTPPVGMNLFIASYRFRKPITELYSVSWPFLLVLLVALMLITYVPWLSLVFIDP